VALAIVALAAAVALGWRVHRHLFAATWLNANAVRVDWQIDRETWRQGGVTAVKALLGNLNDPRNRTPDELASVMDLHRVESLDLSNLDDLEDSELAWLPKLADLQTLNLDQTRERYLPRPDRPGVTDATLARLRGLGRLREISLVRTRIRDAGLAHLSGLDHLEALSLAETAISDAGLEHLKKLRGLKWLTLTGTRVTAPGVRAFEVAMPDVSVTFDVPTPR